MSIDPRDRQLRYYQDRLHQLEQQNLALRSLRAPQPAPIPHDPFANSIIQLHARNQRLQREAELYQQEIKRELTQFIRESHLMKQCSFRRKYVNALSYPPPKYIGLRR